MDSVGNFINLQRFQEPPEIAVIKKYIYEKYQADVVIEIQEKQLIIKTKSAALAGTLRPELQTLQELCNTDKRLVIRIGFN